jgi:hypothetical protein
MYFGCLSVELKGLFKLFCRPSVRQTQFAEPPNKNADLYEVGVFVWQGKRLPPADGHQQLRKHTVY